jgi:hypothetical protein
VRSIVSRTGWIATSFTSAHGEAARILHHRHAQVAALLQQHQEIFARQCIADAHEARRIADRLRRRHPSQYRCDRSDHERERTVLREMEQRRQAMHHRASIRSDVDERRVLARRKREHAAFALFEESQVGDDACGVGTVGAQHQHRSTELAVGTMEQIGEGAIGRAGQVDATLARHPLDHLGEWNAGRAEASFERKMGHAGHGGLRSNGFATVLQRDASVATGRALGPSGSPTAGSRPAPRYRPNPALGRSGLTGQTARRRAEKSPRACCARSA